MSRTSRRPSLPAGGTALLFTDGLVEDRGVLLDDNLEKLRAAAAEAAGDDVEAFANHVMSLFGSQGGRRGDDRGPPDGS